MIRIGLWENYCFLSSAVYSLAMHLEITTVSFVLFFKFRSIFRSVCAIKCISYAKEKKILNWKKRQFKKKLQK